MQKVIKRFSDPNYRRVNQGLWPDATTEEKIKHNLCKSIGGYVKEKNLTEKELGKKLGIDQVKTEYILFAHYKKLSLGDLTTYVDNLHIPLEIKISSQYGRETTSPRAH
jgi:predicted XRE-type DNA-binding protein